MLQDEKEQQKILQVRLLVACGALLCFAGIAYQVTVQDILGFDTVIREWAYAHRSPMLNRIMIVITYMGNWQSITLLGFVLLLYRGTRKEIGIPFAAVSLSSTLVYKIVKSIFARPRPELAVRIIEQGGFSFPSGHSMNGLVCFGILIYLIRRNCRDKKTADVLTVLLSLLIIAIGISRVYVGVHFPTDILGGWSLGAAYLCVLMILLDKVKGTKHDL